MEGDLPTASSAQTAPLPTQEALFQHISTYPFTSDQDYLLGLSTILGHPDAPPTTDELVLNNDLVLQAQCFYLARKFGLAQIDVEAYRTWLTTRQPMTPDHPSLPSTSTTTAEEPTPNGIPTAEPPIERPSAPTPSTAAAATTLAIQPNTQIPSPSDPSVPPAQAQPEGPAPPYPTSFADIVDLITQNKPIPGIEEIPETVLDLGSSKQDKTARRRKPWEKDTPGSEDARDEGEAQPKIQTGEGVMKILQPHAIPDSGLVAKE